MPNCSYCDKPLKTIGYARKNGKPHADWHTRTLHKKCWLIQQKYTLNNDWNYFHSQLNYILGKEK